MFLKKIVSAAAVFALLGSAAVHAEKLSVAATPVPRAELLELVKPVLAKEGAELDIKVFTDYVKHNKQDDDGNIDVNFFQPQPYFDSFNKENQTQLVTMGLAPVEHFGA